MALAGRLVFNFGFRKIIVLCLTLFINFFGTIHYIIFRTVQQFGAFKIPESRGVDRIEGGSLIYFSKPFCKGIQLL